MTRYCAIRKVRDFLRVLLEGVYPRRTVNSLLMLLQTGRALLNNQKTLLAEQTRQSRKLDQIVGTNNRIQHSFDSLCNQHQSTIERHMAILERINQLIMNQCQLEKNQLLLADQHLALRETLQCQNQSMVISKDFTRLIDRTLEELNHIGRMMNSREPAFREEHLLIFLLPHLSEHSLIDVGAYRGDFSASLLDGGYQEAHAFEPHPYSSKALKSRFSGDRRVAAHAFAVGDCDDVMAMHVATSNPDLNGDIDPLLLNTFHQHTLEDGLEFTEMMDVQCRRLDTMVKEGLLPQTAGLLKVNAEGHDLRVLKCMPEGQPYELVMAKFWGDDFLYASSHSPSIAEINEYMRSRGYLNSIHIIRDEDNETAFTVNAVPTKRNIWGNSIYFKNAEPHREAVGFLRAVQRQTV